MSDLFISSFDFMYFVDLHAVWACMHIDCHKRIHANRSIGPLNKAKYLYTVTYVECLINTTCLLMFILLTCKILQTYRTCLKSVCTMHCLLNWDVYGTNSVTVITVLSIVKTIQRKCKTQYLDEHINSSTREYDIVSSLSLSNENHLYA